ncbi:alpha/beta fold hydrolase [Bradyrhizobium sp. USDA 328]|uniref:alpha/beta fold hydrolase n=1 Tax=Bradyrhizobium sp. USDA 328 TaxID=3156309 RepID=UPI00351430E1
MKQIIDEHRRQFLGIATGAVAVGLGVIDLARAETEPLRSSASNASFGAIKQIDAGVLNVGYAEVGPSNGPVAILLHGWPYDIHAFVDVAPILAKAGYRVIVPYLRGYGTTHFLSSETPRNGEPAAMAVDIIALMDKLDIKKAVVAGFDWGARTADVIAALWPDRCRALVSVSGYLISSQAAGSAPLPPQAELQWWYQFYSRHRARPRRIREVHARFRQADLEARLAAVEVRRCHLQSQRGGARQQGSCRDHDPQLPLAARARPGRGKVRASRKEAGLSSAD